MVRVLLQRLRDATAYCTRLCLTEPAYAAELGLSAASSGSLTRTKSWGEVVSLALAIMCG
jgi:hypothetical protein